MLECAWPENYDAVLAHYFMPFSQRIIAPSVLTLQYSNFKVIFKLMRTRKSDTLCFHVFYFAFPYELCILRHVKMISIKIRPQYRSNCYILVGYNNKAITR